MAALAILVFAGEGRIRHPISMVRHDCMPMGLSSAALGFVLIISSLFDGWSWLAFNRTPPPNETIINNLDSTTLTFTLIFGVLAGMFLMWLGAKLIAGSLKPGTGVSMGALTPVIWIWVRVVRYEVSYASAIPVEQSFYDFVMLIFTMLFLFSFARFISKIGDKSPRPLLFYALCTAVLSISGPITLIALFLQGETDAYNSSRLAGIPDLCIGIFAFCTSIALVFAHEKPQPEKTEDAAYREEEQAEQTNIYTEPEETGPSIDEILEEIRPSYGLDSEDKDEKDL